MSPGVEAALIAGGVGVLTLIGTLVAQFYGIRSTRSDTERQLNHSASTDANARAAARPNAERTVRHGCRQAGQ